MKCDILACHSPGASFFASISTNPCTKYVNSGFNGSNYAVSVLELAKIVVDSGNHHFNIHKLFNAIKEHNEFEEALDFDLEKYESEIENYSSTIQEIRRLRDKAFAH